MVGFKIGKILFLKNVTYTGRFRKKNISILSKTNKELVVND